MIGITGKWLVGNWRTVLVCGLAFLCMCFAMSASSYKADADKQKGLTQQAQNLANTRQETISDMQRRQTSVAALDAKYTKELADAKAIIDQLQRDVATGKRRLQLNATCQNDTTASTSGVAYGSSPQLTPDAERTYFRLRRELATAGKQIAGLQEYITKQCIN